MASSDARRAEIEAKLARFDDDAIRIELRRMVSDFEAEMLADFAAKERDVRAEIQASESVDEEAEREILAAFDEAKSFTPLYFQKIYDFIDRR